MFSKKYYKKTEISGKECVDKMMIDWESLKACSYSQKGGQLERQVGDITNALDPISEFVPWITLNGVHTDEISKKANNHLTKLVCDSFTGVKPASCSEFN
jgi:interferon, gamma-inducible protein 30